MLQGRLTSVLYLICILWIQAVFSADKEKPCTIHDGDNFYNLNKLSAAKDYEFTSPGGHKFVLNVCRSVSHESWNLDVPNPQNVGGFIRRDHGDFSIGEANTVLEMKNGHPLLNLVGGSKCPQSDWQASTAIQFMCDTSVFSAGKPELVAQMPPDDDAACNFFIEWRTHFACPHGERGIISGPVAVLLLIILALGMLYLVFQTLWNRYALHRRGFDQVPTLPHKMTRFFTSVGSFFQGILSRVGLSGKGNTGLNSHSHQWAEAGLGGSRYGSGARNAEEEEGMLSGQDDLENDGDIGVNPWDRNPPPSAAPVATNSEGVIRL